MVDEYEAMPVPQRAMLWCVRMWVLQLSRGADCEPQIDHVLETLGAPEIAPALRDLMATLSCCCTRMIEIRCVCRTQLSADERTLMSVFELAQSLDFAEARHLLRRFVSPAGAETVLSLAEAIGTTLVQAGVPLEAGTRFEPLPLPHATLH